MFFLRKEEAVENRLKMAEVQIGQHALDPLAAPGAVFGGHVNRKTPDATSMRGLPCPLYPRRLQTLLALEVA